MQSSSRNGYKVRVLAVHTTEGIMRAADLRAWTGWAGSSHASADETGALLAGSGDGFVDYGRASWTLRSGNPWSENIELCGFAKWSRADWLSRPKLIDACAKWLAARSKARDIPLVKLTPQQYRAGQSGVIGHHDHTVGYSDGTHWDPGPSFPWDVVLSKARDYAGGVDLEERDWLDMATPEQVEAIVRQVVRQELDGRKDDIAAEVQKVLERDGGPLEHSYRITRDSAVRVQALLTDAGVTDPRPRVTPES